MPKVREVIGHVTVEVAKRKRKCTRMPKKHSILQGETCLVIKGGTYNAPQSYCKECGLEIISVAEAAIQDFLSALG